MKKLLLILLSSVFVYPQTQGVYEYRDTQKKWDNWRQDSTYYVLQLTATDSSKTSKEFYIPKGFDGLLQFYVSIDTFTQTVPDTFTFFNGDYSGSRADSTTVIRAGLNADDIDIIFQIEHNIGEPHNWILVDTLSWLPYNNRQATEITTFTTQYGTVYTSRFDPQSSATGGKGYQGDVPLPFRITVLETTPNGTDTYRLELNYKYHNPNY